MFGAEQFVSLSLAVSALMVMVAASAELLQDHGEGFVDAAPGDFLSADERARIWREIDNNRSSLNRYDIPKGIAAPPLFEFPVVGVSGDPGHLNISNYVDHDTNAPGSLLDYNCGDRTYDTASGYNHDGIDVALWPFRWLKVDNDEVEARAAASGIIVNKDDGNFDRNCAFNSSRWNAVYLEHTDGSVSWYGHLKNGSLTTKGIGSSVQSGEYLGVIASSGNSTGPHLHFETFDADGFQIDPYAGACNSLNSNSWWLNQPPYHDSQLNKLATHDAPPDFNFANCPQPGTPNYRDQFEPGELVYFVGYFRDQRVAHSAQYTIRRPDGSTFDSWVSNLGDANYTSSYWYRSRTLPLNAPSGNWQFQIDYLGQVYQHTFKVDDDEVFRNGFESPLN